MIDRESTVRFADYQADDGQHHWKVHKMRQPVVSHYKARSGRGGYMGARV